MRKRDVEAGIMTGTTRQRLEQYARALALWAERVDAACARLNHGLAAVAIVLTVVLIVAASCRLDAELWLLPDGYHVTGAT